MIRIVTVCLLGGIALAFGLSLGLGSRDITRGMSAGLYARKILRPGDRVSIGSDSGTLVAVTPAQTVRETSDGEQIAVANGRLLEASIVHRPAPGRA